MIQNNKIDVSKVTTGIYWVEAKEADVRILCGCPADAVKHLKKRGLIDVTEKDGVKFETGPNVILLSDILMQNGFLSNLAEFPILQMLYSQGTLIPNHPNNTGQKPLLMGNSTELKAQMEYIYRGNYGLTSKEEILSTGVSEEMAEQIWYMKLKFAFGKINSTDNLLDKLVIEDKFKEIKNGVEIRRKDVNIFEIKYQEQNVVVDLNLKAKEFYEAPYYLGYHKLDREYFSVVHTGEGDAWDVNRPCMASVVMFQGKIYLIDAGPDLMTSLNALGITVNEVAGIFNTHAHDDHFAGLTSFIRSDHKIKYFATPLVRASVAKKLCALMSTPEDDFNKFFEVCDLEFDTWNNIEGLEVMPVLSPHPVETNIFFFRTFWDDAYKVYAHFADICSLDRLKQILGEKTPDNPFAEIYDTVQKNYLYPSNLKKIDIGGGLIHGNAKDFKDDKTEKILLAHISRHLDQSEKDVGSFAPFGSVDSLITTHYDFLRDSAYHHLKFYFPNIPDSEINALLNSPVVHLNAGDTLFRKGERYSKVYLLLTGAVELIHDTGMENSLTAGSLVGFYIDDDDITAKTTCRALGYSTALEISADYYLMFVKRHHLVEKFNRLEELILFLGNTWLLSENISLPIYIKLAKLMRPQEFKKGEHFAISENSGLYIVKTGKVALLTADGGVVDTLEAHNVFGAENLFSKDTQEFEVFFLEDSEVHRIPMTALTNIPIIYWKLSEVAEKRRASLSLT